MWVVRRPVPAAPSLDEPCGPRGSRARRHGRGPLRGLGPGPPRLVEVARRPDSPFAPYLVASWFSFIRCHSPRAQRLATAAATTLPHLPRAFIDSASPRHRGSVRISRCAAWMSVARSSLLHPRTSPAAACLAPLLALQGLSPQ